jgi:hypothetical protein
VSISISYICCIIKLFELAIDSIYWDGIIAAISLFSLAIMLIVIGILGGIYLFGTGIIFHPSKWF